MRRADRFGGILLLLFAIWYSAVALRYPYSGPNGPGSGFLPFWLGVAMGVLALLLLTRASRPGPPDRPWLPQGRSLRKLGITIGATALFIALLKTIGMILGVVLFLVGILRFVEGYPWRHTLGIALGIGVVNYLVFTYWLRVPFPTSALGF